jgi:hypothetical protein
VASADAYALADKRRSLFVARGSFFVFRDPLLKIQKASDE